MGKERQSNMELLRIIAMALIVMYHISLYSLVKYEAQFPIISSFHTLSHIGVVLFVLISGYFGIEFKIKGLLKLYISVVFYNILMCGTWLLVGKGTVGVSDIVKLFMPFSHSGPYLWFLKAYILLYLISPLLNAADEVKFSRWTGKIFVLILLGAITFWFGWINKNSEFWDGRNLVNMAFLYVLGSHLRDVSDRVMDKKKLCTYSLWMYLAMCVLVGGVLYFAKGEVLEIVRWVCHSYCSPVLICMAAMLFLCFTTIKIRSRFVNWVAASVLSVYLIHENRYFFLDFFPFMEKAFNEYSWIIFIGLVISSVILMIAASTIIDQARVLLLRLVDKIKLPTRRVNTR